MLMNHNVQKQKNQKKKLTNKTNGISGNRCKLFKLNFSNKKKLFIIINKSIITVGLGKIYKFK